MSLEKLKVLRKRRVEAAQLEYQKSKEYLLFCEKELANTYQKQQTYSKWCVKHQDDLFEELQGDYFSPDDLGKYRANLEKMKFKKQQLAEELVRGKKKYQAAEMKVQEKKAALSVLTKKLEKLSEIIDIKINELSEGMSRTEEDEVDDLVAFRASF